MLSLIIVLIQCVKRLKPNANEIRPSSVCSAPHSIDGASIAIVAGLVDAEFKLTLT
jgi:hypothetical protein